MEALAHEAINERMRVAWYTLESLEPAISSAAADGSIARTITRITRCDDIGMLPSGHVAGEAFYRLVDAAYTRRSLVVTSNLHPSGFDSIMSKTIATAAVVRLMHHAHVAETEGPSTRLSEVTGGRGVIALN